MKSFICSISLLAFVLCQSFAQQKATVVYSENIDLKKELKEELSPEQEAIFAALPSTINTEKELLVNGNESIYRAKPKEEESAKIPSSGGGFIQIEIEQDKSVLYCDNDSGKSLEFKNFMGRDFLIEEEKSNRKWKIVNEQKMILGYRCMKAVSTTEEGGETVVWFAPEIKLQAGPGKFNGLPGLVLEVSNDNGKMTISAKEIKLDEVEEIEVEKPKKGKKVTQEEFLEIVKKKSEELKAQFGGGDDDKNSFMIISE